MTHRLNYDISIRLAASLILALSIGACSNSGSSSPTEPVSEPLVLESATLTVDGQEVQDGDYSHNGHQAQSTRFEARLTQGGHPPSDAIAHVDFERPGAMGGMMPTEGRFTLYDDGTHGDHVAGDGLYCLEDSEGTYGFHHHHSPHGHYHFEYFGMDQGGHESNHLRLVFNVVD